MWLILSIVALVASIGWFLFSSFAAGMSSNPQASAEAWPSTIIPTLIGLAFAVLFFAGWWFNG